MGSANQLVIRLVRATPKTPSSRLDPFDQFDHYPTHLIGPRTRVSLRPGVTFDHYQALRADPLFPRAGAPESLSRPIWEVLERGPSTVDVLSAAAKLSVGWGISVIGVRTLKL